MMRRQIISVVYAALLLAFGATSAGAVIVNLEITSKGEPIPGATIRLETTAGGPIPVTSPDKPLETHADGAQARKPKDSESGSEKPDTPVAGAIVTTGDDGKTSVEVDDHYKDHAIVVIVEKDGKEVGRKTITLTGEATVVSVIDLPPEKLAKKRSSTSERKRLHKAAKKKKYGRKKKKSRTISKRPRVVKKRTKTRTAPKRAPAIDELDQGFSCFTGNTLVLMADGSRKPISKVRVGDKVRGQKGSVNRVIGIERPKLGIRKLYGFNGKPGFVTAEHPFMTSSGWKSIDPAATFAENPQLRVGVLGAGDSIVAMAPLQRQPALASAVRPIAYLPGSDETGRLSRIKIETIAPMTGDPAMTVYNLLLDGDRSYFANGFLVHNKGG